MILYTTKKLLEVSRRIYHGRWEWLGRALTLFEVGGGGVDYSGNGRVSRRI